ncbi:MAG TPA: hypothetical protein VII66_00860 [Gemmatimonadaceae bacterium]
MRRKTYGFDRMQLHDHYSADELADIAMSLRDDPANRNTDSSSVYLYNRQTRKALDNIAYAIYWHQLDASNARGVESVV